MSSQLEIVEAQALKLSPEERAHLADRLVASLFKDQEIEDARAVLYDNSGAQPVLLEWCETE